MNNDLISRRALKEVITANHYLLSARNNSIDYGMFTTGIMQAIDNAPEVELVNHLRDRIKVIDYEITIPQSYEAKCFLDGKRKAFQYVLDLLETKKNEQ